MRVHPFKSIYPNNSLLVSPDSFFRTMGKDFPKHYDAGLFTDDDDHAIFVYQVSNGVKYHRGIVLSTDIHELINGNILFHEDTIAAKEQDMVESSLESKAMIKPILLFYEPQKKIDDFIDATIQDQEVHFFCDLDDGTRHTLWKITEESSISYIQQLFDNKISKAYIADGHHRCSATRILYENNSKQFTNFGFSKMLSAYFSINQVEVYDHIKFVSILDTIPAEVFIAKLSKFASIKHIKKFEFPKAAHRFTIHLNEESFSCKWKKSVLKTFKNKGQILDAFISNKIIFNKIFKIDDVRKDNRISFYSGKENPKNIILKCANLENAIGISLFPLSVVDIKNIADLARNLPPKSTWFEPRIKSGVIAQKY